VPLALADPRLDGDRRLVLLLGLAGVDALACDDGRALDRLDEDVIRRPDEVEDAVPVVLDLVGRRARDAVDRRLEQAARQQGREVAKVDGDLRGKKKRRARRSAMRFR
jgi:hypothetical protein